MAPPLTSLYTTSFFLALLATVFVIASLRVLAILPSKHFQPKPFRRRPTATRILIVLGSGGHTHEMFYLLRDLDTTKYTHRTYVVSSGDAFSASRAAEFERELEDRENAKRKRQSVNMESGNEKASSMQRPETKGQRESLGSCTKAEDEEPTKRPSCVGPDHYNIAIVPRARRIHQSLLTTPFTSLFTLISAFRPLLAAPSTTPAFLQSDNPPSPYEAAAQDLPDMIITNGPATAVIVVLSAMILRFFNVKGAHSRVKCKTVYVESFARVTSLSLSGRLLLRVADRFLVQWPELEGQGGRAEFLGILV